MKKFWCILLAALTVVLLAVAVHAADVYVTDGGTGNGSSASSPLGDMTAAIQAVADGGTVHIVGTYTCADQFVEPLHSGDIVIEGGKYIFDNGKFNRWILFGSGSTTFQNVEFVYAQGSTSLIVAQYNDLIIGEGVSFPTSGKCYIVGGYQAESDIKLSEQTRIRNFGYDHDSHITVKSGNIWCVAGFNRGNGSETFIGTSHITVEGGAIDTLYGANINGNYADNTEITVTGGTVKTLYAGGDATRRLNGCATITVTGGTVEKLDLSNVLDLCTVNYEGGTIGTAVREFKEYKDSPDVSGIQAVLNTPKDVSFAAAFDTVNKTEATTPAPAEKTVVKLTIGKAVGTVNGEEKPLDAAPIIANSRTMLPVRFLAEAFGAQVGWDGATSTATITADGVNVAITIGAATAQINGETIALDSPAFIQNGRTYLPVRVIADALGAEVAWDGTTSTATLTK